MPSDRRSSDGSRIECATGREQLARPFKYVDQLTDTRARQQLIDQTLTARHAHGR